MNSCFLSFSQYSSKRLALILLVIASTGVKAQYKVNFGLSQPQDPATMPISLVKPQTSVLKSKIFIPATLQKAGENEYLLSRGWEMADEDQVIKASSSIFSQDFNTKDWYNATVPGTVLTTLVDQGVYPDPYFGLNNLAIPESLCRQAWWYRLPLQVPVNASGKSAWLLFNGINYKADIWLNGHLLGKISGAFARGEFDVTDYLNLKGANVLAVHIYPPNNPGIPHEESLKTDAGPNGGQLCLDGPTFISSEGWDWVPGIRDRNIGIWQDVRLRLTDAVTIVDPQIITDLPLPDTTSVAITVKAGVRNNSKKVQDIVVTGQIADVIFSKKIELQPNEVKEVALFPAEFKQLNLENPRLWWPNGYGKQDLYNLNLQVKMVNGQLSDQKNVRFGVREYSYEMAVANPDKSMRRIDFNPLRSAGKVVFNSIDRIDVGKGTFIPQLAGASDTVLLTTLNKNSNNPFLTIKVNGVPVFCKGGNWGMDDAMKRVSRERLEPNFKLHKEANFNMVRNWTGESTEAVFYDLCDEYGMLVWNDFWLSTEGYNLNVNDNPLFMANATEVVRRFRNHPSIAIWCPRNEGYSPIQLEPQLQALITKEDGTRLYQPNSRNLNLRPSGPWRFYPNPANYSKDAEGFNTEIGIPSVPTAPSMLKMMAKEDVWPISDVWAYHDFHSGQKDYCNSIENLYGRPASIEDYCKKAQLVNYESHRAMFEAWNSKLWNQVSGVLLWMTHPAWPSTDWQVYSWDYETLGSYFGSKKACEPVHIQMNLHDKKVVVVNCAMKSYKKLAASMEVFDLNGKKLGSKTSILDVSANQLTDCFTADLSSALPEVYMVRLYLTEGSKILSQNDYWQSTKVKDCFAAFNQPTNKPLKAKMERRADGKLIFVVSNPATTAAIGLKFNLLESGTNKIVLPAYFSDGYFTLLPGEKRELEVEWNNLVYNKVKVVAEAYNSRKQILFESK